MSERTIPIIDGEVIPTSRGKALFEMGFGAVIALAGLGVYFFDFPKIGFAMMFGGVGLLLLGLMTLFSTRRLVLGADALQEIAGQNTVILHVPYGNIADLVHVQNFDLEEGGWFVGIKLHDPRDPDCYCKSGFASVKNPEAYDIMFTDHYTSNPTELHRKLKRRLDDFSGDAG